MIAYAIRRILMAIPTLWVALTMIFILVRVIPGDPTTAVMGDYVTEKSIQVLKQQMGLDRPLIEQYGLYLYNFIRGDFGNSLITGSPVLKELKNALPHTLELTFFGLLIGVVTGIPWDFPGNEEKFLLGLPGSVLFTGRPFLPLFLYSGLADFLF